MNGWMGAVDWGEKKGRAGFGIEPVKGRGPRLPRPLPTLPGVKYVARVAQPAKGPAEIVLTWYSADKNKWRQVLDAVRALPGRKYSAATKQWSVKHGPAVMNWLKMSGWNVETGEPATAPERRPAPAVPPRPPEDPPEAVQKRRIDAVTLEPMRPLIPGLRPYQVDFVKFMSLRHGRAALGDDMGTGKTVQALAWLAYSGMFPALIVVNAPTKHQWAREFDRWLSTCDVINPALRRVGVLQGRTPYFLEPGVSYIINWDVLADWAGTFDGNNRLHVDGSYLVKAGFKCLIGDEVQAIGNPASKRSRAFRALSKVIPSVIGMSGTPVRSRPLQFWPLLDIMDHETFGDYNRYRTRYCAPKATAFGVKFDGASHVQELHRLLVNVMLRRTKGEVMKDLPKKTIEVVPLDPDEGRLREYRAAEAQAFTGTDGVSKRELRERVAGLLRSAYAAKEAAAMAWVRGFLDDSENKLLLFAWHRDVVDLVYEELKAYSPAKIYGGLGAGERDAQVQKFINDPSCRIMVANIQAGGVGIDGFQKACSYCAFLEFSHTPTDMNQAMDRLHRGGQLLPVTAYYLVARGTIDIDAIEVLDQRTAMLDGVLDGKPVAECDMLTELLERKGVVVPEGDE